MLLYSYVCVCVFVYVINRVRAINAAKIHAAQLFAVSPRGGKPTVLTLSVSPVRSSTAPVTPQPQPSFSLTASMPHPARHASADTLLNEDDLPEDQRASFNKPEEVMNVCRFHCNIYV